MNNTIAEIQSLFPNREVSSIYNINSTKSDIVVVEDWTFFQFSAKCNFKAIVVVTSIEDYIDWRRMLRIFDVRGIEVFILITNKEDNAKYPNVKNLIEQDKLLGIKFLSLIL